MCQKTKRKFEITEMNKAHMHLKLISYVIIHQIAIDVFMLADAISARDSRLFIAID